MRTVLDWAGARDVSEREIILGGPMMGQAVASLEVPVTKAVSGILVFDRRHIDDAVERKTYPCIKCGECVNACPMGLNPSMLGMLAARREYDLMGSGHHIGECFECGCCTYVCPAHIPLVQQFKVAKAILRERAAARAPVHESGERFDFGAPTTHGRKPSVHPE
jgi:electron transport complex protein RnfC